MTENKDFFTISQIAQICGAELYSTSQEDVFINRWLTDSRRQKQSENCLFIALKTAKNDGHAYISSLYESGFRHFLLSEIPSSLQNAKDVNFIVVSDPLKAMQTLAKEHRMQYNIPVLGITGSNGKTILKEWIASLLRDTKKVVKSPKSYNSQIGVPLSVLEMRKEHEIAIFEAGISQVGEMANLEEIIRPTVGIFTNIGVAHDEYFLNHAEKISEKLKLFDRVGVLIYNWDHIEIRKQIQRRQTVSPLSTFTWSEEDSTESDIHVKQKEIRDGYTSFTLCFKKKNQEKDFQIPFTDRASFENLMHAISFLTWLGISWDEIAPKIKHLEAVEMRMQMKEGKNHCYLINDFYNSDYDSLQIALDLLLHQHQNFKRRLILSDVLQSGRSEEELYTDIANVIANKKIDSFIGIGSAMMRQSDKFLGNAQFFPSTDAFLQAWDDDSFQNETILLKGARVFAFEKISRRLQKRTHETVLEINLNTLVENLQAYKEKVRPGTKMMVMGKAFSYGSGSYEIANLLEFHHVDYITVAYIDEGVLLRKNGISLPMMVMNPEEEGLEKMLRYHLEPEVYSFSLWNSLKKIYIDQNCSEEIPIHIKMDTGMHRLGFVEAEVDRLIEEIKRTPFFRVRSIFTHLATADDPKLDDYTLNQLKNFERISEKIKNQLSYPVLRHALNTAGIERFPQYAFDMVRLGIGLYGDAGTLKTLISQIREISPHEGIGYGRKYITDKFMKIGIIPIGYADGLVRALGNGLGRVYVGGKYAPIIGNICMDMCMIDLSDIPLAKEKDEVIIFGKEIPISELAEKLQTIPYEILTGISSRVKRVYYQE